MHLLVKALDSEGGSHWKSSSWLEWGYPPSVWHWHAGFESSLGPPKQTNLKLYQYVQNKINTPSFKITPQMTSGQTARSTHPSGHPCVVVDVKDSAIRGLTHGPACWEGLFIISSTGSISLKHKDLLNIYFLVY